MTKSSQRLSSRTLRRRSLRLTLAYAIGTLGILAVGELVVVQLVSDTRTGMVLDIIKYGVFVVVSGLILYGLIHRSITALENAEARYRNLVDNASDIVFTLDVAGRFTSISASVEPILGYRPDELLGRELVSLAPDRSSFPAEQLLAGTNGEPNTVYELTLLHRSGRPIVLEINRKLLYDAGEKLIGVHGVARDITARRQTAAELEAIVGMASALRATLTQADMLPRILTQVTGSLAVDGAAIGLYRPPADEVEINQAYGVWQSLQGRHFSTAVMPAGEVLRTGRPYLVADRTHDAPRGEPVFDTDSVAIVPLLIEQKPIGLLAIGRQLPIGHDEVRLLTALADIAATALHRAAAYDLAQRQAEDLATINALGRALIQTHDLPHIYRQVAATVQQLLGDVSLLLLSEYDAAAQQIRCVYGVHEGAPLDVSELPALPLGSGPQSEAIRTRRTVITNDFQARVRLTPRTVAIGEAPYTQSALSAPLLAEDEAIGVLQVQSYARDRYDQADAALLTLIANTAAAAIQNARLFEAERQQRGLAEALRDTSAIINSTLNFDEVLDRMLATIGRVVPHDAANIMLIDPATRQARIARRHGYDRISPELDAAVAALSFQVEAVANLAHMLRTRQPFIVPDTEVYEGWVRLPETGWQRSALSAPICLREAVVGFIHLDSHQPDFFTAAQAERLQAFANQAAIAIENARLFEFEREQRALSEALHDTAGVLTSSLDIDVVLMRLLSAVGQIVPNDLASILEIEGDTARVARIFGQLPPAEEEIFRAMRFAVSGTPNLHRLVVERQALVMGDVHDDPGWVESPPFNWIRSFVAAPIQIGGRVTNVLVLYSGLRGFFTPLHAERLQILAAQAAVAIGNAQLFDQSQRRVRELAALFDSSVEITATLDRATVLRSVSSRLAAIIDATSTYVLEIDWQAETATVISDYLAPTANDLERISDVGTTHALSEFPQTVEALKNGRPSVTLISQVDADPAMLEDLRRYGGKSALCVPLMVAGQMHGYVVLWDSRIERLWTETEIRLAQTLANQSAVALDNVRLFEAERKQLKLAQTLQAVGALLTAEMSLDEVFEYLFDLLARVVNYDSVSIQLIDGEHTSLVAGRGFPDVALSQRIANMVMTSTLQERWGQPHRRYIVIPDTHRDPHWVLDYGNEYIRSWIGAALRVKGRLLGILNLDSATVNAYDDTIGETAAAFANQAAIAIENAQLNEAVRRHAEELEARVIDRTMELELERKRTAAVLDTAGEGIILTDPDGHIQYINPAMERLTGFQNDEVVGQNSRLWQSGQTSPALYHEMWTHIKRGHIWQGELVNRRKDGTLYDAALTIAPLTDAAGQITGFVGVQRDITHQKELDRLKDEFVSNVSHELRTPIANVKLYLSLLTRGKPEKQPEYLQTLRRETARLEQLIEDLLDLSRLDLGTTKTELGPIDLATLLAPLVADRSALASARQLTVDYQAEPGRVMAVADSTLLVQVASNLLTNAINYTPAGGTVSVIIGWQQSEDQRWATFSVKNSGPGISEADRPHLFERFYRGEAGRKSGAAGTGLGLAISRQIVDRLGGRITVDSQPGQGAVFTVWLRPAV